MKILVTGVLGQLGNDVIIELISRGFTDVRGIDINDLDITDENAVKHFFGNNKYDVIIHCAAYTQVDNAEIDEQKCYQVNVLGTKYLVDQAALSNAKFIYISTDYVFDGEKNGLYDVEDKPSPISVYGKTKYLGEIEAMKIEKHFIVRISWVFGKSGKNFVKTILRLSKEQSEIKVVNDQLGSPTYTKDLSKLLLDMMITEKFGIYHATNEGICTWYEFAKEILSLIKSETKIIPISTSDFPTKAKRPKNSSMNKNILDMKGFNRLPSWKVALENYIKNEIGDLI